jgi:hypothetical protein
VGLALAWTLARAGVVSKGPGLDAALVAWATLLLAAWAVMAWKKRSLAVGGWAVLTWFALGVGIVRAWATGRAGEPGDAA